MASMLPCHDGLMGQGGVFGLVTGTIFKIAERQSLSLAGSIPVRLRHVSRESGAQCDTQGAPTRRNRYGR
jgi:hypothetical protein